MSHYELYLANAAVQREQAERTALVNRRAVHLRSAEMWDHMAAAVREKESRTVVNEAAKTASKA